MLSTFANKQWLKTNSLLDIKSSFVNSRSRNIEKNMEQTLKGFQIPKRTSSDASEIKLNRIKSLLKDFQDVLSQPEQESGQHLLSIRSSMEALQTDILLFKTTEKEQYCIFNHRMDSLIVEESKLFREINDLRARFDADDVIPVVQTKQRKHHNINSYQVIWTI
jgi:hypothetical protein